MYASTSLSNKQYPSGLKASHQRVSADAAVSFKQIGKTTKLDRLYQNGSAKIRFPKTHGDEIEAVFINTAGGLTGGDRLGWNLHLGKQTNVVATSQACEKSYRSSSGKANLTTQINLEANSSLHWLPQETIIYEQSSLCRRFEIDMDESSTLLSVESMVLGREAMGEKIHECLFQDRWRIRQNGILKFADDLKLNGSENANAQMADNRAIASLIFIAPRDDELLHDIVKKLRVICSAEASGFSAFDGKITGRILSQNSYTLRQSLIPVLKLLRGGDLPRVWRI